MVVGQVIGCGEGIGEVGRLISNRMSYRNHYMCSGEETSYILKYITPFICSYFLSVLHVYYVCELGAENLLNFSSANFGCMINCGFYIILYIHIHVFSALKLHASIHH